jgi:hypothetical protein
MAGGGVSSMYGGLDAACPDCTGGGTRRVRFVRGAGRGASGWYGARDAACPVCTGGGAPRWRRCRARRRRSRAPSWGGRTRSRVSCLVIGRVRAAQEQHTRGPRVGDFCSATKGSGRSGQYGGTGRGASGQYGGTDAARPVSTGGRGRCSGGRGSKRRVVRQRVLVRRALDARRVRTCPVSTEGWTRRVQSVRRDGRDVSTLYGREGGGGGAFAAPCAPGALERV